jgi:PII-like signaling protein
VPLDSSESVYPSRPARRLTIFVESRSRSQHQPVKSELTKRVRRAKLAGYTVFQGDVGYGHSGRAHHSHLIVDDAPTSVVVIDRPELIDEFLADIDDLIRNGLFFVVDDIEVVEV